MPLIEQRLAELRRLRRQLKDWTERPLEDLGPQLLRARAVDLAQAILSGDRTKELFNNIDRKSTHEQVIEMIDAAIAAAEAQGKQRLAEPDNEPYLASLVSRALWSRPEVRVAVILLFAGFALALGAFGVGVSTIFTQVNQASQLVLQARAQLEQAQTTVKEAKELEKEVQDRIAGFNEDLAKRDVELKEISERLESLKQEAGERLPEFDKFILVLKGKMTERFDKAEKIFNTVPTRVDDMAKAQADGALAQVNERIKRYNKILDTRGEELGALKRSAVAAARDISEAVSKVEGKLRTAEGLFDDVPSRIDTLARDSARPVVDKLDERIDKLGRDAIEPLRQKVAALTTQYADITGNLETRHGELRKQAGELEALQSQTRVRFGTVQYFADAIVTVEKKITAANLQIDKLENSMEPVRVLVAQIDERSIPVEQRIVEAMALSSEKIADRLRFVLYSNQWLLALAAIALIYLVWLIILTLRYRRTNLPTASGDN